MEQQNQITVSAKNQAVSEYLQNLSNSLSTEDLKVLEYKYAEKNISQLSDIEIINKAKECLLRIHVITGWNLPDDSAYMNVLIDEFVKKLKEDFYMLNFSEISFAFRKSTGKQDWGKNTNLELISTVLAAYSHDRAKVSLEEENLNDKPEQKIYTDEELLSQQRGRLENAYQCLRNGIIPIIEPGFEQLLKEDGFLLDNENIDEFFVRKLNANAENLYTKN